MNFALKNALRAPAKRKTTILFLSVVFFFAPLLPGELFAQKRFSKTYPAAGKAVRLELTNLDGTVDVSGWDREQVEIKAELEAPAAEIVPQNQSGRIVINVLKDNHERGVGSCNFKIKVPYSSSVDIQTRMGNLIVSDVRGMLVSAHISTEGDITLTNIFSPSVSAKNMLGNIFFDGEIQQGGNYRFISTRGEINLRIPFNSSFRLVATAPSTRSIDLGAFNNGELTFLGNGQRVFGRVNGGSASLTITNHRGKISFIRR